MEAIAVPRPDLDAETFLASLLDAAERPMSPLGGPGFSASGWEVEPPEVSVEADPTDRADVRLWAAQSIRLAVLGVAAAVLIVPLTSLLSPGALATVGDRPFAAFDDALQLIRAALQAAGF